MRTDAYAIRETHMRETAAYMTENPCKNYMQIKNGRITVQFAYATMKRSHMRKLSANLFIHGHLKVANVEIYVPLM